MGQPLLGTQSRRRLDIFFAQTLPVKGFVVAGQVTKQVKLAQKDMLQPRTGFQQPGRGRFYIFVFQHEPARQRPASRVLYLQQQDFELIGVKPEYRTINGEAGMI